MENNPFHNRIQEGKIKCVGFALAFREDTAAAVVSLPQMVDLLPNMEYYQMCTGATRTEIFFMGKYSH